LGLLGFFQGSPLKKLESEAENNPSPDAVAALAQKHIELGQMEEALVVAERGLQTFRNTPRLKDIVLFVKKKRSADAIRRLRDEIRVKPAAQAYSQLADIYRDLGDLDQALDLLAECTERLPGEVAAWRLMGQIRLENYLQEVIAYDGLHAWRALSKVRELSPEDAPCRMLLAQLFFAVGANALSVQELKAELAATPTALDIKGFLDDLGNPPPLPKDLNIESLIERCEETGALTNSLKGFPRLRPGLVQKTGAAPKINPVAATGLVRERAGTPGVLNLAVLDREGRVVASVRNEGGLDEEAFREAIAQVAASAGEACRRMDIGSFARGSVAFPTGGAAIVRRRGTTFAMFFGDPMKQDRALPILEDFVQKMIGGGGGA